MERLENGPDVVHVMGEHVLDFPFVFINNSIFDPVKALGLQDLLLFSCCQLLK